MDNKQIQDRVKKVIANVLKTDVSTISDDANFIFDLGADSMQSMELIAAFEEEFDIEMDEDKALEVQTVSDAVTFISGYFNK
ncbi:MAG: acyl carrier protein [Calditrichia bacterium]|jgi:acyl carrier protein|nr:acyl carrier protein [Calditrichia bacterium]